MTRNMSRAADMTGAVEFERLGKAILRFDVELNDLHGRTQTPSVTRKIIRLCALRADALKMQLHLAGLINDSNDRTRTQS